MGRRGGAYKLSAFSGAHLLQSYLSASGDSEEAWLEFVKHEAIALWRSSLRPEIKPDLFYEVEIRLEEVDKEGGPPWERREV